MNKGNQLILGIDLGTSSLGWTLLDADGGRAIGIHSMGVRVFDEGLEGLQQDGRGASRNVSRRNARMVRRNIERRARRQTKLAHILKAAGLFPDGNFFESETRHEILKDMDKNLESPYILRARALDQKLPPLEVGRALYHLGQRRGFSSNRKTKPKNDEDLGTVKKGISELAIRMQETGARTLGEYFSKINPHEERIRERYTSRRMYEDEFEQIWNSQKNYHAQLTDELKKRISDAIFKQRPLKSQKHLIGDCELEKGRKRAPIAIIPAQRFRYLQTLNNLLVDGRELTKDERKQLIEVLENEGDITFPKARKLLGLPRTSSFNLERGGETRIPGNRTTSRLREVFGERWEKISEEDRDRIVEDMRSIVKGETLKRRAMKVWGLDEAAASELSETTLEDKYCAFSRQAIDKLLPLLKDGLPLQTAIKKLYPERFSREGTPLESLPPVKSELFTELRNPLVERSLTELRKVVNALTDKYGKPDIVRIELARELRQSADQRENSWKRMRANEKERKKAAEKILNEAKITRPSRDDVLKVLLAEECRWQCPYTGRQFKMAELFGDHPQYDIEHIIPFDRSLDDSYMNKTLCHAEENRKIKRGKTPYEAYSKSPVWDEIVGRVKRFNGDARDEKLRRFLLDEKGMEEFINDFTSRQLNDTRYASRKAKEYLGLLYGGVNDDGIDHSKRLKVQATTGQITSYLRSLWGLNTILGDGPGKSRDDHRHHAVDALTIALTEPMTVTMLNNAAKNAMKEKRRRFAKIDAPWLKCLDDAREAVSKVVVSPRISRRVRGKLHAETFYSAQGTDENGKPIVHVRKPLSSLTSGDIENIVDKRVQSIIKKRIEELGGGDPKKLFSDKKHNNHPFFETTAGKRYIRRVRVKQNLTTFTVGKDHRTRHVTTDTNHHMEIIGVLDENGAIRKWEGQVVGLPEAYRRLKAKESIIRKDHGDGKKFLFSLANGEVVELDENEERRGLYVVRTITSFKDKGRLYQQVKLAPINDARKLDDIKKDKKLVSTLVEPLRKLNCRKVVITPLGEIRCAND